jgi:transcriptional regulator with XRE-family HTH domain
MSNYVQWIPEAVRMLRGKQTLKQVAEKTGLSVSYLSDIENSRTNPSIATLDAIFVACGSKLVIGYETDDEVRELKREWVFIRRSKMEDIISSLEKELPE